MKRLLLRWPGLALGLCLLLPLAATAQTLSAAAQQAANKLSNPGFEASRPAYWTPTGAGAVWSDAVARSEGYSLQLTGSGAASWTMGEAVRNWTDFIGVHGNNGFQPGEIVLSAYVRAEGVNVNPATDAQKFQLVFEFFDAPGGTDILGGPVVIDLPQSAASTGGWVKVDNTTLGAITLPAAARSVRITFRKGAEATGTMYLDDLAASASGGWPGTIHNGNVDAGANWYYYTPDAEGQFPSGQTWMNTVTDEEAHTGTHSLKIMRVGAAGGEAVHISERVPVTPNEPLLISFWVKNEGNEKPEEIGTGDNNIGLTALWYTNMTAGSSGYGEVGGVDIRLNGEYNAMVIPLHPREAANGWKQYAFVVTPPVRGETEPAVVGMELRLRYWHAFTGTTYWDDVFIGDVADVKEMLPNSLANGDFEANRPSYWASSGGGAMWSDAVARSEGYSLQLTGSGAASWTMGEAVRNWTDFIGVHGNNGFQPGEIKVGGWVKSEGVNTNPTSDAQKFQLVFEFYSAPGGTDILGGPVVIDLPQSAATMDWTRVDNTTLGAITLPAAARSVRITFRKGAEATGTMYLDDLLLEGTGGWPGTIHNANVDAGAPWYYFTPDSEAGYPNGQTFLNTPMMAAAYEGNMGLRIARLGNAGGEAVHISDRVAVNPGEPVLISFRMRTTGNEKPEEIGTGDNNVGLTGLWYTNMTAGRDGYGEVGGFDVRFNGDYNDRVIPRLAQTADTPWKQYAVVAYPPVRGATEPPVVGMELRLRYWHAFTGNADFDNVFIPPLGGSALVTTAVEPGQTPEPAAGARLLLGNSPNPFGTTTMLAVQMPQAAHATLEVYDLLGRRVATLVDGVIEGGTQLVPFDASDLPAGTYVYVLKSGSVRESRVMTVVR